MFGADKFGPRKNPGKNWIGIAGLALNVMGAMDSGGGGGSTQPGQSSVADPFAGQRPQYQQQLQQLMTNPGSMTSNPMYQFSFNQGMEGVNRGMAKSGELGGGARMTGLQDYGQGQASQQFSSLESMLANLAGASSGNPGMAGQLGQQNQNGYQQGIMQSLGGIGNSLNGQSGIGGMSYNNFGTATNTQNAQADNVISSIGW